MHRSVVKITDENVIFIINKMFTAKSSYYNADNHVISFSCGRGRKEKFAHQRSNKPFIILWLCSGPLFSGNIFFGPMPNLLADPWGVPFLILAFRRVLARSPYAAAMRPWSALGRTPQQTSTRQSTRHYVTKVWTQRKTAFRVPLGTGPY